jgi:archaea-specific DNA-binding protein
MEDGKDNTVFVGTKPFMNYVTSLVMQFTTKGADEVFLKARGKFISKAVDIVEVTTKRFMKDKVRIREIKTNSEDFKNKEGRDIRVSTIEIILEKME